MDKTRGFYPFDVGSIPTRGTGNKKVRFLPSLFIFGSVGIERRNAAK